MAGIANVLVDMVATSSKGDKGELLSASDATAHICRLLSQPGRRDK